MKNENMQGSEYKQIMTKHLRTAYLLSDDKIEEVLPRFLATLENLMHDLEEVFQAGTIDKLNRTGHTMKGALLNLGLKHLADIAFAIEKFDPAEAKHADITVCIAELRNEINKIL